ncbi:hypothetical protein ALO48_200062 [Pseudomonas syringae pv. rhaphiolepidis]|nr:hypothetical protein ALO48_200062 [Pseudomonas syringae pv. rhaphiolepidis]
MSDATNIRNIIDHLDKEGYISGAGSLCVPYRHSGNGFRGSDGSALTAQRVGNWPRVRSVKPQTSFLADRVAAGNTI